MRNQNKHIRARYKNGVKLPYNFDHGICLNKEYVHNMRNKVIGKEKEKFKFSPKLMKEG